MALIGEVRVFYFREYELHFASENGGEILDELLGEGKQLPRSTAGRLE